MALYAKNLLVLLAFHKSFYNSSLKNFLGIKRN